MTTTDDAQPEATADTGEKAARSGAATNAGRVWGAIRAVGAYFRNRYPELPPAPGGIWPRVGLGVTAALAVAFVVFYSAYLFATHDAYLTHAEDLGIMDQALWTTLHGAPLHQTICNSVSDTNCLGDVSRLGIHFEPIMFVLSLLYLVVPSPKTLQFAQAVIVASGAFPAYWLASRRLRSTVAGVAFAAVFLLFPALQAAVTYDFHAVTLSAAFLMFALYFMLSRNNWGLVIACLLALSTKEELPLAVGLIGLSVALLQRRWRLGWGIVGLAAAWLVLELVVMKLASPLGHSPTASRYAALGDGPVQIALYLLTHPIQVIQDHVLEITHRNYLRGLLSPVAYLPILSPLALLIAVPALAINLLSSDPTMYSGIYHYNAEIVPILVFSTVETVALLGGAVGALVAPVSRLLGWTRERTRWRPVALAADWAKRLPARTAAQWAMLVLTLVVVLFAARASQARGESPLAHGFSWPVTTAHAELANHFVALVPPDASVSAQSDLVPHLSERRFIYMYPYMAQDAAYVLLDVTGNLYPQQERPQTYFQQVVQLLTDGSHHIVAAQDGYILLAKGAGPKLNTSDPYGLPAAFYSFTTAQPSAITHAVDVRYGDQAQGTGLEMVGYDVSPAPQVYLGNPMLTVTTYWRVTQPLAAGSYMPELVLTRQDGSQFIGRDFAAAQWLPVSSWQPGQVYALRIWPYLVTGRDLGTLRIGFRVTQAPTAEGTQTPLPITAASGATVAENGTLANFASETVLG